MSNPENKIVSEITESEIIRLNKLLKNVDIEVAVAMSNIRRIQRLTFKQLEKRFSGINGNTLKRYMQPSYHSMRPLHVVAAYSWITMVPLINFYHRIIYRDLDNDILEVLMCIGKLPSNQFEAVLNIIVNLLNQSSRQAFLSFKHQLESQWNIVDDYNCLFPPKSLDINAFAIDFYRSLAITIKKFRETNHISIDTASRVTGLSQYQYRILEDVNKIIPISFSIGIRTYLAFNLHDYSYFTSEMRLFPEFHTLRTIQHIRDSLIIEGFKYLNPEHRKNITDILITLSDIYR
jgi:hypothetical protein